MAALSAPEFTRVPDDAADVATHGDPALPLKPAERGGKSCFEARWAFVIGMVVLTGGMFVADSFTFGIQLGNSRVGKLFSFDSLGAYAAELTLVVSVAMLLTMRSMDPAVRSGRARKAVGAIKRPDYDGDGCRDGHWRRARSGGGGGVTPAQAASQARVKCTQSIELAVRQGDWEKGEQLLVQFERSGSQPEAMSYNLVIRTYAKRGDAIGAEQWLERMEANGVSPTAYTYNTLLDLCAKTGKAEACGHWLKRMMDKGVEANVISYATAIYAYARRGDVVAAQAWLETMLAADIQPDAITYSSLIHACGVKGAVKDAERWLDDMVSRGLKAGVATYTSVIDACAKSGDIDRAEFWLAHMIEKGVEPNAVTFSAMIDSCAKVGNVSRAEHWHEAMLERGIAPDAHSFSAVINACAKQLGPGGADAAEKWLGRSEQAGVGDVVIYSSVIDACGKAGEPERALRIFRRMQANGFKPQIVTYAALARPFAHRGDWVQVESIAQEMEADGIKVNEFFLYAQLLSYAVARQPHRAEACFRSALRVGVKANDHVVGVLARAVGRPRSAELMSELCGRTEAVPRRSQDVARGRGVRVLTTGGGGSGGASKRMGRM